MLSLIYLGMTVRPQCILTSALVRAVSVDTIRSHVTSMASIEALIDI